MPYPYQIWDVFTDTPLAGNPLAVVFDADGIATERAQAIAGEFNLSETIFLAGGEGGHHQARIFTPAHEMPFAGHPTVGGSIAAARRAGGLAEVTLDLPAGPAVCRMVGAGDGTGRATIVAPKIPEREAGTPDTATLARTIGVPEDAIGAGPLVPSRATSGPRWTMIPLRDASDLANLRIDRTVMATFGAYTSTYVIAPDATAPGKAPNAFRCRMFAPVSGVEEDPATGSAAVAFTALWVAAYAPADGAHTLAITQGVEMGRPSDLTVTVFVEGGAIARVELTGSAVLVAEGTLLV